MTYDRDIKDLVILRLRSVPSDMLISVGNYGDFTGDQLIKEVDKGTQLGDTVVRMHLLFIRKMPTLSKRISELSEKLEEC